MIALVLSVALLAVPAQRPGQAVSRSRTVQAAAAFTELSESAAKARVEGRDDDAIRLYGGALNLKPDWQEGLWYLGTLLYQKERFPEARDVLRRFVAQAGEHPQAGAGWAVLGMSEFQTREYARALDHLKRAMAVGVGERKELSASVNYFVSVLLTRFEQFEDSTAMLYTMRGSGQPESLLLEPAGLAALRLPLLPAEIPADRRDLVRTAGAAAFALADQRRADLERFSARLIEAWPREPGVQYLYGVLVADTRPEESVRAVQRELEISPSHVAARLRLAEHHLKEKRADEALRYVDEALKLDPDNPSCHLLQGEARFAKGDIANAIVALEIAREQAPEMLRARWALFRAYSAAGRTADATREREAIRKLTQEGQLQ